MKNPKAWDAGFHRDEIDEQIARRQNQRSAERQEDVDYASSVLQSVKLSIEEEGEREARKWERNRAYAEELRGHKVTSRDTFDLDDRKILQKTKPPRMNDTDAVPVSSLQKFDGEDLGFADRTKKYQEITRTRLMEQMNEHEARSQQEKEGDRDYAQKVSAQVEYLTSVENEKASAATERNYMVKEENIKLAKEMQGKRTAESEEEAREKVEEIEYQKNSKFLTEKEETTLRVDNPDRYIPYHFKGYNVKQTKQFFNDRLAQVSQQQSKQEREKRSEQEWHRTLEAQRKHMLKLEMERKQSRNNSKQNYANELREQASLQKSQRLAREQMYTNTMSNDFFAQFGTSTR